jgi:cytochrome P450
MRETRQAFDKMLQFMKNQVSERRTEIRGYTGSLRRSDAFTALVKANEDESAKYKLDDEELVRSLIKLSWALFPEFELGLR